MPGPGLLNPTLEKHPFHYTGPAHNKIRNIRAVYSILHKTKFLQPKKFPFTLRSGQCGATEPDPQVQGLATSEPRDHGATAKAELGFLQSITQVPE